MKAKVRRAKHYEWIEGSFPREYQESWVYIARHECGWYEELHYWHSAFWAADHHVRHDCGRRNPSSGGFAAGETPRWIHEGGVLKTPTPSDTGHPLPPGCDERAGVQHGVIATNGVPGLPGVRSGIDGAAWWDRLWHGRQR